MAITLAVGEEAIQAAKTQEVEESKPQATLSLNVRKSADGNIMIMDHTDIDVIVMPGKNKVLAIAKDNFTDDVYDSQNRLFKYLGKKGVIDLSSIRSGNVYGSLEGSYIAETFNEADPIQTIVFGIGKFMEEEKPYFMYSSKMADEETNRVTDPDKATSLGDVDHEANKGNIPVDPRGGYYLYPMFEKVER
mgnify:CR=1 FL=1|tara:strand:+ start:232 stop:804 length:573 start_codon:yes stop_codon:yes gene_type:complete